MLLLTCSMISRIGIKLIGTRCPVSPSSSWANTMLPWWAHLGLSPALYVDMGLSLSSNCLVLSKGNQTTPISKLSTSIILPHYHAHLQLTHNHLSPPCNPYAHLQLTHNHPSPPCNPHAHLQLTHSLHIPPCSPHAHVQLTNGLHTPPCKPDAHFKLTHDLHTLPCMKPTCSPSAHPQPSLTTMQPTCSPSAHPWPLHTTMQPTCSPQPSLSSMQPTTHPQLTLHHTPHHSPHDHPTTFIATTHPPHTAHMQSTCTPWQPWPPHAHPQLTHNLHLITAHTCSLHLLKAIPQSANSPQSPHTTTICTTYSPTHYLVL